MREPTRSSTRVQAGESDRVEGAPHPRQTSRFFGNAGAETALLEAYRSGRLPHAWLFGGPRGIGKATLAWRFARYLGAHPDPTAPEVAEAWTLDVPADHPAARHIAGGGTGDVALLRREVNDKTGRFFSEIRVDDVRRALGLFQQSARAGGYRICIIDSAEDLNRSGANALLKLIEEPPALSLFVVLAHRPGQIMPTLRSRCRQLMLQPPTALEAVEAVQALGPPWSQRPAETIAAAVTRAGHSIGDTLHWLGGDRLDFDRDVGGVLARLPVVDWNGLHHIADRIGGDEDAFETLLDTLLDWLHRRMRSLAGAEEGLDRRLAPLAEVWDKIRRSAREAQALNLDKRSFLFAAVSELAQATREA